MITFGLLLRLRSRDGTPALPAIQSVATQWWSGRSTATGSPPKSATHSGAAGRLWEFSGDSINAEVTGVWTTELRALEESHDAPELVATLTMRIQAANAGIRPLLYQVAAPGLLRSLNEVFEVRVADEPCLATPLLIDELHKIEAFVTELTSLRRVLPIVAVTETQEGTLLLPGSDTAIARYLFGVARVVRLRPLQAQQLTNRLGKKLSCFHGGVRIYWPGFSAQDSPRPHTLFTRTHILWDTNGDLSVAERRLFGALMARLARATVGSFDYPAAMTDVLEQAKVAALRATPDVNYEDEYLKSLESLRAKDEQIALLEKRLAALEVEQQQDLKEEPDEPVEGDEWAYSPAEAIAAARVDFRHNVVIPNNLEATGDISGGTIYFFLRSLSALCDMVRSGRVANVGNELRTLLASNGVSGGRFQSGPTSVYATMPDGSRAECRSRYHLRSGAPTATESVYWADEGEGNANRRYVVARIGLHA